MRGIPVVKMGVAIDKNEIRSTKSVGKRLRRRRIGRGR